MVRDTAVALEDAERFGDNVSLAWARIARGMVLTRLAMRIRRSAGTPAKDRNKHEER